MVRLILLGATAGAFFSATFIINELMSIAGGHWYWSASLRYMFMFILLSVMIVIQYGPKRLLALMQIFSKHWLFWSMTGSIGFGWFYAGICFAADHASGWVVASTFMFTVVASLIVLRVFGQHFERRVIVFAVMIFLGVILVNLSEATHAASLPDSESLSDSEGAMTMILFGALPALLAAFSYPIGNQLVWQAAHNAKLQPHRPTIDARLPPSTSKGGWIQRIPTIQTDLLNNAFNKVWLMTVGSAPFWILLGLMIQPKPPSLSQTLNTFLVALLSGVIATSIFLFAREQAQSAKEMASVDATQASEVIFALIGGMILLHTPLPSLTGIVGIGLIILGLVLFARSD